MATAQTAIDPDAFNRFGAAAWEQRPEGVDVAAEMVSLARRLRPEIEFREADAEQLPYADGSFDATVANFLIPHLGRPELVAAELTRVLRPNGKLALSTCPPCAERRRALGRPDGRNRANPGARARPAAVEQARIRDAFERLVRPWASNGGGLDLPVSVKLPSGRRLECS